MKCKYCSKTTNIDVLGISGAYKKDYNYCPEHKKNAEVDRDNFLLEKLGKRYDEVITPPVVSVESTIPDD
jgi:hypothetical protein